MMTRFLNFLRPQLSLAIPSVIGCLTIASLFFQAAIAQDDFDSLSISHLEDEQVRWLLSGPNGEWCPELLSIARLVSKSQPQKAREVAQKWIERDFFQAYSMLPGLNEITRNSEQHLILETFRDGLEHLPGPRRMEILAMLDMSNAAVRKVSVAVMKDWWDEDAQTFKQWILKTPCFFEESRYGEFLTATVKERAEARAELATLYLSLRGDDIRRNSGFSLIMDYWARSDGKSAREFIDSLYQSKSELRDPAVERVTWQMSYQLANEKKFAKALQWVSRVNDREMKELAIRDHSLGVDSEAEKAIFLKWLESYTFESAELEKETKENLENINQEDPEDNGESDG